jgi:hypothetical protein
MFQIPYSLVLLVAAVKTVALATELVLVFTLLLEIDTF